MLLKKNIKAGKVNFPIVLMFSILTINNLLADNLPKNETTAELSVLDKVSSKNSELEIKIGNEKKFKNLLIKALKCKNSEFDDNPEITAYLQVKDTTDKSNDEVFVFNGWTFSSSPSVNSFDHPVYDIWLTKCY